MTSISVLIVEDDPIHQASISGLLATVNHKVKICGLCSNIEDAYKVVNLHTPDVVFLDIDLDFGQSGFDLLLKYEQLPFAVVFATHHTSREMAIQALRASAVDYLTKPFTLIEVELALERAIKELQREAIQTLRDNLTNKEKKISSICISSLEGKIHLKVENIVFAESDNVYTRFHLNNPIERNKSVILSSESIKYWEQILSNSDIIRIHNEFLVNISFIEKLTRKLSGVGEARLHNDKILPVSRSRFQAVKSRLKRS